MIGLGFSSTELATRARASASPPSVYSLDFTSGSLPTEVSLARTTSASHFTATGDLAIVGANVPRFDHDPVSGAALGLLIEDNSVNLLTHSACVLGTGWVEGATNSTNLSLSALGTFAGVETFTNGANWARLLHSTQPSVTNGATYGFTLLYRAGTSGRIRCILRSGSGQETRFSGTIFGSKGILAVNAGALSILSDETLTDGVTRRLVAQFTAAFSGGLSIGIGPDSTSATDSIVLLGAQLETGVPGSYIPTSGATATRLGETMGLTGISGTFDISATYGDDTVDLFTSQSVGEGYWPTLTNNWVKSLVLTRL